MKRLTSLFLSLLLLFSLTGCADELGGISSILDASSQSQSYEDVSDAPSVWEGEFYYDLESVVLYLDAYGQLPDNFITKKEAQNLGWQGGSVEKYLEGAAIGGDRFGNREGLLPKEQGRSYTECDLNTDGADSRGAERLVFSNDGLYFHTGDHYETFTEVWIEDGEVVEGMKTIRLDCTKMTDRERLHDYLAQALDFPDWYGRNLDALYDLLTELGPTRLELDAPEALEALGSYQLALLDTLHDAAEENPNLELVEG